MKPKTTDVEFERPCEPRLPTVAGNDDRRSGGVFGPDRVRADIRLAAAEDGETKYDLSGHVRRTTAKFLENFGLGTKVAPAVDLDQELRAAEAVLASYSSQLEELYRAYGAFMADGPVAYRPLMTRLGLWQVLVDSNLHASVSPADFDDLLCEYTSPNFRALTTDQ